MLTRRQFLQAGIVGGAATLLGGGAYAYRRSASGRVAMGATGGAMNDGMGGAANVTSAVRAPAFQRALPLPADLVPSSTDATTDYYDMTLKPATVEIIPGLRTAVWGYNGQYPGPTIRAKRGRRVVLRQTNTLAVPISTHFHGGHVPAGMDGHPMALVQPGSTFEYVYPNEQLAATLWYHDHAMGATATSVYRGLAGFYLLEDEAENKLGLPSGAYDIPLVIQDRAFAADGALAYPAAQMMTTTQGFLGDTVLVNGAAQPFFQVATRKYRFRVLNGSNARHYDLALSDGQPLTVIASDGGLLPQPVSIPSLSFAPGERYELIVDFARYPVGTQLVLRDGMASASTADILRFDVTRQEPDDSALPATLRPQERLPEAGATVKREFTLNMTMASGGGGGGMAGMPGMSGGSSGGTASGMPWVFNNQPFDARRVDAKPRLGDTEIWTFKNPSMMGHPIHLHDVMFQVLDRNGGPALPQEAGWKDTVHVNINETVRVIAKFTDYKGVYVFHCHVLEHEDNAMMGQFEVV